VADGPRPRGGQLCPLLQARGQPLRSHCADRAHLVLLPENPRRYPPPGDGHRRRIRARRQQDLRHPDHRRICRANRGLVVLHFGSAVMSLGDSASPLGKVRGIGASGEGGEHWLTERVTSIALLLLGTWLLASLLILPSV